MAIVKVGVMTDPPVEADYTNLIGHLNESTRLANGMQFPLSGTVLKLGSYINHGGVLYQVQTSDYTVLGSITASVFNYVKIASSGAELTATWVTDISAYSWSNIYNYLIHADESQILSVTEKDGVVYRLEGKEVIYKSNQNLKTTDNVSFATVNTGQGANELYDMNQNVKTDSTVHFANVNPPVDNNDSTLPSIGIGGFTFLTKLVADGTTFYFTLPSGGAYILISGGYFDVYGLGNVSNRFSGGSALSITNSHNNDLVFNASLWRIS